MHVVATAGHVDHGKSTLVRALTGMEPDRWAEELRRGMTIDLGFAWTRLPGGETVAFVDVPGHERFVPTMLAGVGAVPAVLLVVAADEGWRRQSAEHLAAITALGVTHGLLVLTRSDLAEPAVAEAQAREQLSRTALRDVESVAVSAVTGDGLDRLRDALSRLVSGLPLPDREDDVRLWVDRSFSITGAGAVVTGTLTGGAIEAGDVLSLPSGREVRVRGLQSLGQGHQRVEAVSRVAVNLRGIERQDVRRGDALLTPASWHSTTDVDVRVLAPAPQAMRAGAHLTFHIGSAAVPARVRPLGEDILRLRLASSLPLRIGDRALLREPSNHEVVLGVTVLDPWPPALIRRGDARRRGHDLAGLEGRMDVDSELRRRGIVSSVLLRRLGAPADLPEPLAGDWLVDADLQQRLRVRATEHLAEHRRSHPLEPGMATGALADALGLPDAALVPALLPDGLVVTGGLVLSRDQPSGLPAAVQQGVDTLRTDLGEHPFAAPGATRLRGLGLGRRELAAAARAGELLVLDDGIVLLPDAPQRARESLSGLPPTFTVSQARQAWQTTRRVALPLLELLDRTGVTVRLPDGLRELAG
ncbi:MAG: selenocysteine-specific elongation factor [Actinomycetota bacterium]|nr:selenocysteine-specific elongation factor [Actinomycetota bacterium]